MKKILIVGLMLIFLPFVLADSIPSTYSIQGRVFNEDGSNPPSKITKVIAINQDTGEEKNSYTIFSNGKYMFTMNGLEGQTIIFKGDYHGETGKIKRVFPKKQGTFTDMKNVDITLGLTLVDELPDSKKFFLKSNSGEIFGFLGNEGNMVLENKHVAHSQGLKLFFHFITSLLFEKGNSKDAESPPRFDHDVTIENPQGTLVDYVKQQSQGMITGNLVMDIPK